MSSDSLQEILGSKELSQMFPATETMLLKRDNGVIYGNSNYTLTFGLSTSQGQQMQFLYYDFLLEACNLPD
ncbi:hypothetical protein GUJ93_ZPchr0009g89 [Zizania palustris]|uniref:Uncharacterized protein n=1 Tax=Zizania palustris TaxID=103762 RepID=A0A8J5R9Z3_ZIZPA|nr:hypothetical protein GUJ93_ZPchr0009g89 [Zizania palustris]